MYFCVDILYIYISFFFNPYPRICLLRERKGGGRERETSIGHLLYMRHLGICPDLGSNPLSQLMLQPTEPPGQGRVFYS